MNFFYSSIVLIAILLLQINYISALHRRIPREVLYQKKQPESESWVKTFTHKQCEKHLEPVFQNMNLSSSNFDPPTFCADLTEGVRKTCTDTIEGVCEKLGIKFLKVFCKAYLADIICE